MKIRTNRTRYRRGGFTMIEMLVATSLAAVLLSINALWIYQTMRFSSRVNQRHRDHQSLTRLAGDFCDDVRSCQTMEMIGKNEIKLIWLANGGETALTTNYKSVGSEVFMTKQKSGTQARRERFSLARNSVIAWDDSEMPKTISLVVSRDPNKSPERQSKVDQKVDSTDSLPPRPTATQDLVTLMHVRVSPDRWAIKASAPKQESETETETETKSESEMELESKIKPKSETKTELADQINVKDENGKGVKSATQ